MAPWELGGKNEILGGKFGGGRIFVGFVVPMKGVAHTSEADVASRFVLSVATHRLRRKGHADQKMDCAEPKPYEAKTGTGASDATTHIFVCFIKNLTHNTVWAFDASGLWWSQDSQLT